MSDEPENAESEEDDREDLAEERTDFAEDRTNYAEDRTLLANERTFSGWARTAMAAIGIGLGFKALFQTMEPAWIPKAIATLFMLLGIILVLLAERRARKLKSRLDSHAIEPLDSMNFRIIAVAVSLGAASLIAAVWILF